MTRARVTRGSGSATLPESLPTSNIVDFPRPYIAPAEMVECTRDWAAGWTPYDEDKAFADAALEMVGEWLPWIVCFIVAGLIGVWLAVGHS